MKKKTEIAQRSNFVTDKPYDVENTHDYHLLMVIVEALWTLSAGNFNITGEALIFTDWY